LNINNYEILKSPRCLACVLKQRNMAEKFHGHDQATSDTDEKDDCQ
jgi:hypothetical protein